ncbi:MAG: type II toxin-antitoxin system HicB family antitoxin [Caldilineaceae bacterium]|nr:type II toxin-antitoxin system HicB family antitoxin [Caldilineaceae bacterium]
MNYKGYKAVIQYDERDHIFHGHLLDTYDDVYFEGSAVEELEAAFREAVDDYLTYCVETGREPTKAPDQEPKGTVLVIVELSVQVDKKVHNQANAVARKKGVSLDAFVEDALSQAVQAWA